ncbi:MAG: tetratricopeptide repeat protein [Fibrobacteria bacterium]
MKKFRLLLFIPVLFLAAPLIHRILPEQRYSRHLENARRLSAENNLAAAEGEYEKAYRAKGGYTPYVSLEVVDLLARKSLQSRNPKEALAFAAAYVRAHPGDLKGRMFLAELAFHLGDAVAAVASLNAALAASPGDFPARLLLARVRSWQGRSDLAEEQFGALFRAHPDSVDALLPLAGKLLIQGRVAESRAFLRQVLAGDPKRDSVRFMLIDSYVRERNPDSARELVDRWPGRPDPDRAAEIAVRKARIAALPDSFAEAKALLLPFVKPRIGNAQAMAALAVIHASMGEYDSAAAVYENLTELDPDSKALTERLRTLLFLKNQNPARALEAAKQAQVESKSDVMLGLTLAAYLAIGQENKAADLIQAQPESVRARLSAEISQWVPDKVYLGQWALAEYFRAVQEGSRALRASDELRRAWPDNALANRLYAANLAASRANTAAGGAVGKTGAGTAGGTVGKAGTGKAGARPAHAGVR